MSDETDDVIDITDVTKTPAWTSAPETIGLALGDETEDWCFDFNDAADVTWFSGPNPVDICVTYVRSDIVADLRARLSRQQEWIDAVMGGPTVGYYVYVAEHDNGYVCETEDEYCDDATNHNAEVTELIIRPQPLAKE